MLLSNRFDWSGSNFVWFLPVRLARPVIPGDRTRSNIPWSLVIIDSEVIQPDSMCERTLAVLIPILPVVQPPRFFLAEITNQIHIKAGDKNLFILARAGN
jgi:hypothetical protein